MFRPGLVGPSYGRGSARLVSETRPGDPLANRYRDGRGSGRAPSRAASGLSPPPSLQHVTDKKADQAGEGEREERQGRLGMGEV